MALASLTNRAGTTWRGAIENLEGEPNPYLYTTDLFRLARAAEASHEENLAAGMYQTLVEDPRIGEPLRQRAQDRLATLQGGGPWGLRLERYASRFVDEVTSPSLLLGMVGAGWGYRAGSLMGLRGAQYLGLNRLGSCLLTRSVAVGSEAAALVASWMMILSALHSSVVRVPASFITRCSAAT